MAEPPTDSNMASVIDDLRGLRDQLFRAPDDHRSLLVTAGFLLANRTLIQRAVEVWISTSEAELQQLHEKHRELDQAATTHKFSRVGTTALDKARLITGFGYTSPINGDDLKMLSRVLEFSKYLLDTSDLDVQWHPVSRVLARWTSAQD